MFEKVLETTSMPAVYCQWLIERAKNDRRIVVIENDLAHASGTVPFGKQFPDRFFDIGVAEANSVCIAAGMSSQGYIPFVGSLVTFITRRCYDQIMISVAYSGLNVKLVGTRPGVTSELNGGTHFGIGDVGIVRSIPGFTIVDATDNTALRQLLPQVADLPTPVYLRFGGANIRKVYGENDVITIGRANTIKRGKDATIIANDLMVGYAMDAVNELEQEGLDIGIIDMHTIKPIDRDAILEAAAVGPILTAENHSVYNGLGSAVAEVLVENNCNTKMKRFGFQDRFGVVGKEADIAKAMEVSPAHMAQAIRELLK